MYLLVLMLPFFILKGVLWRAAWWAASLTLNYFLLLLFISYYKHSHYACP